MGAATLRPAGAGNRLPDKFDVAYILKFTISREEQNFLPPGNSVADTIDRGEFFAGTRCFSFLVLS